MIYLKCIYEGVIIKKKIEIKPSKASSLIAFFSSLIAIIIGIIIICIIISTENDSQDSLFKIVIIGAWIISMAIMTIISGINAFTNKSINTYTIEINDSNEKENLK